MNNRLVRLKSKSSGETRTDEQHQTDLAQRQTESQQALVGEKKKLKLEKGK